MRNFLKTIGCAVLLSVGIIGCSQDEPNQANAESPNQEDELISVKQLTNWFAQPDFGGQYAALEEGYYEDVGLDMTIESGGPQISEIQIVASGEADFGMATGDELLAARQEGLPVVAIAALFQVNPQVLLYHEGQDIEDFNDLNGRTVFVAPGVMYWEYLKDAYELGDVNEMAFSGQFNQFIEDETAVSQAYLTTAPYNLSKQGVETEYLLVNDSGYETYADVLFTTEDYIEEHPEIVQNYVEASLKGWDYYKTNYEEINKVILEENPDLNLDAMKYSSEQLMDLVFGSDAAEHGVGYMSNQKWKKLAGQLKDIGILTEDIDVEEAFTTEFLPE
ncbi:ABC transporter substrate-binding protein [Aquibacillus albus]|uniref:NitT/TauT family transport system substrate-binding protein n=1 Tax=Aquibacillus albus TaxID=1168171 RepID=A0ABS2MW73_9BACI|nr:ABC transporter substrate-binding protein [Aquibacillus albus]MBM7570141.1 NitT/TauT family transport system substrate-binding protein [Aquibacillus albus]